MITRVERAMLGAAIYAGFTAIIAFHTDAQVAGACFYMLMVFCAVWFIIGEKRQ